MVLALLAALLGGQTHYYQTPYYPSIQHQSYISFWNHVDPPPAYRRAEATP